MERAIAVLRVVVLLGAIGILALVFIPGREPGLDWGRARAAADVPVPAAAEFIEHVREGGESREQWKLPAVDIERVFRHYDEAMAGRGWNGDSRPPGQHDWTYAKDGRRCRVVIRDVRFAGTRLLIVLSGE